MLRRQILDRSILAEYRLVLDQSVLARNVGGIQLWAAQMEELEKLAGLIAVHVRVLPLDAGGIVGVLGPFAIISMSEDDAIVYRETWNSDEIIDDPKAVSDHERYFDTMWEKTLSEDATVRLIHARAASLYADLDRFDS